MSICVAVLATSLGISRATLGTYQQYLLDIPSAAGALNDVKRLNQESHYSGTRGDWHLAEWMRDKFRDDGFISTIETFYAEVPQPPTKSVLQLLEEPAVDFNLRESGSLPFDAWSGSGNVTAPLVDAKHGSHADYVALHSEHIAVRSRLLLIAYSSDPPQALARRAARHGALGVIFWSDSIDHPSGAVQRATVGPPQLRIPVLPVSAEVGQRLLQSMRGHVSNVPVHLLVKQTQTWEPLWNTVGMLAGSDPTHTIVLGAHRDSWVYGATDNGSGISTLLEAAHALGYLYRGGWRPRYTIVIAGWDAGDIGNLGSAQYVRDNFPSILNGCLTYIDANTNVTGEFFSARASASLRAAIIAASQRIDDPRDYQQSLYDRWKQQAGGVRVAPLDAGDSDFKAFLDEAHVPVLTVAFLGKFGIDHSAFDDLHYATAQADPGFANHRTLAQMMALLIFQLANGTLPNRFVGRPH